MEDYDVSVLGDKVKVRGNNEILGSVELFTLELTEPGFSIFGNKTAEADLMKSVTSMALDT